MAAGSVRVEGLRELNRDLGKYAKDVQKQLQKELRAVAEPVAADIRSRDAAHRRPFTARTIAGTRAGSSSGQAVVRQRAGKTSGKRADFGVIQMQTGFLPALKAAEPATVLRLEAMLDRLAGQFNA